MQQYGENAATMELTDQAVDRLDMAPVGIGIGGNVALDRDLDAVSDEPRGDVGTRFGTVPDQVTASSALMTGEIDYQQYVPFDMIGRLEIQRIRRAMVTLVPQFTTERMQSHHCCITNRIPARFSIGRDKFSPNT